MISPERWFVLSARIPEDDLQPLLAEGLLALGGFSVLEHGDTLTTYLPPPEDPEALIAHAEAFLADWLMDDIAPELSWSWEAAADWQADWKRGLEARKLGERIIVKPSWTQWDANDDEIIIEIDPEMAFGTGEHATTRGCLRLLEPIVQGGERVLDVGSGSGILSIAAAMLGAEVVVAVEADPDSNLNARDNIIRNGVADKVRLIEAYADDELLHDLGEFDIVVANILSGVIRPLLPAFRRALDGPESRLILSGILQIEAEDVIADAEAAGLGLLDIDEEEVWWSGLMRPSSHLP